MHSRFNLGTSYVDGYEGEDGDDADAHEDEETSETDDGSMQNVEHRGYSTREGENWTVYFRPVQYNNGEANATASIMSKVKTVL